MTSVEAREGAGGGGRVMLHELKIEKQFADAVLEGRKTFEVRKNDRGFNAGDLVRFEVVEHGAAFTFRCYDHPLNGDIYRIGYVLSGWGLEEGYVAFSIHRIEAGTGLIDIDGAIVRERVVRCRDCGRALDGATCGIWCMEHHRQTEPDGFCAWGVRREQP